MPPENPLCAAHVVKRRNQFSEEHWRKAWKPCLLYHHGLPAGAFVGSIRIYAVMFTLIHSSTFVDIRAHTTWQRKPSGTCARVRTCKKQIYSVGLFSQHFHGMNCKKIKRKYTRIIEASYPLSMQKASVDRNHFDLKAAPLGRWYFHLDRTE